MKSFLIILLIAASALTVCCFQPKPNVYYIDFQSGSDDNPGRSPSSPWKTVKNVSLIMPGDSILFKGGTVYMGNILWDSIIGHSGSPVVISSYGNGKAIFEAGDSSGIVITNSEHVVISRFLLKGSGRLEGNRGNGVKVQRSNFCKIDSIEAAGFLWSGINISGGSNIEVTRSYAHHNGFCGIYAESGENEYGPDGSEFRTLRNLRIAFSTAENNPGCPLIKDNHSGSGILIAGVENGLIEHCEAMYNGWDMPRDGNGPVGIWAYMSDSVIIRYCYSHHNKTSAKGKDGGGFDFDGGVTNSIMQYNLSAFNEGAGYGIFQYAGATAWSNNLMCYNISYADGLKNGEAGIFMWYDPIALPMKNFHAFNNTIVSSQQYAVNFDPGVYENFLFENNIFLLRGTAERFVGGDFSRANFRNNIYWFAGKNNDRVGQPKVIYENVPLIKDPLIIMPDSADFEPLIGKLALLPYFKLKANSPCIGSGNSITIVNTDFWGNRVTKNIGADASQPRK